MKAIIRKLVTERGFGFAILNDSAEDVFIHASDVRPMESFAELQIGTEVEIASLSQSDKGYRARGITLT